MKISKNILIISLSISIIVSVGITIFLIGYKLGSSENTITGNVVEETLDVQEGSGVPKSNKPKVELFVMSHCPYGTQIEKGIIPVVDTLGDKINFEVKFVNYAMHGEKEVTEQLNQYCIQKTMPDKFLDYLKCFLEAGDGTGCMNGLGITENSINDCKQKTDAEFKIAELMNDPSKSQWKGQFPPFNVHDAENKKYGVGGSPTLIINEKSLNTGRDAVSLLKAICNAFTSKPKECNTDLSSHGSPAPGFGFQANNAPSTAAGCGT